MYAEQCTAATHLNLNNRANYKNLLFLSATTFLLQIPHCYHESTTIKIFYLLTKANSHPHSIINFSVTSKILQIVSAPMWLYIMVTHVSKQCNTHNH